MAQPIGSEISDEQFNTPVLTETKFGATSCILYHTDSLALIDIPTSIAHAQAISFPSPTSLISCPPLKLPYQSHEPKSESARERLRAKMSTENDAVYADLIASSLATIRQNHTGSWCLPRSCDSQPSSPSHRKRKANDTTHEDDSSRDDLLDQLSSNTAQLNTFHWRNLHDQQLSDESVTETSPWPKYLFNSSDDARILEVGSHSTPTLAQYYVPPNSAFYLGDCAKSRPFHMAVRDLAQQLDTTRQFDIIVMDPPWPNASVRRTEKSGRSAYQVSSTVWDIRQLIFEMDIDVLLANQGLVAIWITNKPAIRDLVLGEDGLFESWDVQLEEEWLWIKTTQHGDPVSPLDALWRKPYEVLLVGRKRDPRRNDQHVNPAEAPKLKRRVVVGVPDLHSRKPCLKALFNSFIPSTSTKQRTLECFARYLVHGWWSWGNQVIKFNHTDFWQS